MSHKPPFDHLVDDFLYHSRETEDRHSPVESTLIEEVDRLGIYHYGRHLKLRLIYRPQKYRPVVQLQKLPLGFSDGGWASGWILTLCVQAGLQAYVRKKTQEEPSLVHGVDSHPLLFCALLLPLSTGHEIFQSYNLEMLGLLLKVGTNPNQNHLNTSIWGVFLSQCYIKRQYIAKDVERVLAQVFTLLVKHGAEPEAKIETGKSSEKATFSGRIMKYSVYTSVSEIIEACCPDEVHNFRVVIEKQRGYSILKWIGWK